MPAVMTNDGKRGMPDGCISILARRFMVASTLMKPLMREGVSSAGDRPMCSSRLSSTWYRGGVGEGGGACRWVGGWVE